MSKKLRAEEWQPKRNTIYMSVVIEKCPTETMKYGPRFGRDEEVAKDVVRYNHWVSVFKRAEESSSKVMWAA